MPIYRTIFLLEERVTQGKKCVTCLLHWVQKANLETWEFLLVSSLSSFFARFSFLTLQYKTSRIQFLFLFKAPLFKTLFFVKRFPHTRIILCTRYIQLIEGVRNWRERRAPNHCQCRIRDEGGEDSLA